MEGISSCKIIASSLKCPKFIVFTFPIKSVTDKKGIHFFFLLLLLTFWPSCVECYVLKHSNRTNEMPSISFQTFFGQAFQIVVDS